MRIKRLYICLLPVLCCISSGVAHAALTVDRSRLIFNEGDKSVSLNVTNRNESVPYLAQGWMEDGNKKKITEPFMVLPPVQRVEAGGKTLVRIQALPNIASLPKDRESVYYFNLREIPPKSDKKNVLTLAMQTRLKVFYRPSALRIDPMLDTLPATETLTLTKHGDKYKLNNPTPYHFSFVEARKSLTGKGINSFKAVMASPKSETILPLDIANAGTSPVLIFVNDYGSQRLLPFICKGSSCNAGKPEQMPLISEGEE